jgi:hypothetical protein
VGLEFQRCLKSGAIIADQVIVARPGCLTTGCGRDVATKRKIVNSARNQVDDEKMNTAALPIKP